MSEFALKKVLDQNYTKITLLKLYDRYLKDWIASSYIGVNLGFFDVIAIGESSKKEVFTNLLFDFYGNESSFKQIFENLPEKIQKIFLHLAWKGKYYLDETEKKELLTIVKENYKNKTEPKEEYLLFNFSIGDSWSEENRTYFYLHDEIIKTIRDYLDKPKDYYINKVENPVFEYFLTK